MTLLVRDLIEQVDTLVPNALSIPLKLSWMTMVQNELYRDYPVNDAFHVFVVKVDQQIYLFPDDCTEERVKSVMIGGEEYVYLPLIDDEEAQAAQFWTTVSGQLVIHPKPTEETEGYVFYRPRPTELSADDLDAEPDFPSDFIELLILGCAARVCKAINNLPLASVFDADFIRLADAADRKLTKVKPRAVRMVRGWS